MNNNHGGQRKGAGRPPTGRPRKVKTSITLAPALLAVAEATGNRSAYIEALIRRDTMSENEIRVAAAEAIHAARPDLPIQFLADSAALWADEHGNVGLMRHADYGATEFEPMAQIDAGLARALRQVNACFKW